MLRSLIQFRRHHSLRPMDPAAVRCLHSKERLHALVHRERARADRTGHPFALVTFHLDRKFASRRCLSRLAKTALSRSRVTDDVGWFDGNTVAGLLPETTTQGAWTYAQGVADAHQERTGIRPEIKVFTYPSNWTDRRDREERAGSRVRQPITQPGDIPADEPMPQPVGRALAMEPLFVKPIPTGKRVLDIAIASAALTMAAPIMLLAAAAVKLTSPGPVIFRQQRAGLGGEPFTMYKFRSMRAGAEKDHDKLKAHSEIDGPVFKMKNDPRITTVGRFIRKTSIDELPQLFNVLMGDMSLVGPRPPIIKETEEYESWQNRRLEVTPGITCIWQVSGRSGVTFDQWMRMDAQYALEQSVLADLKILAQTVPAVLFGRGAC